MFGYAVLNTVFGFKPAGSGLARIKLLPGEEDSVDLPLQETPAAALELSGKALGSGSSPEINT